MPSPEVLERRLRIMSFIFVAIGILLTIGNSVIASQLAAGALTPAQLANLPQGEVMAKLLTQVAYDGFANRCLGTGLFFIQLGILFFVYLLFSKVRIIEGTM
ncbi:MAG: hypothetical protein OZSIB_3022 [Candidatus Ozemobacter sibiricus]|uniref:Uncharacterized protein n=1 Tax=Candidatus Ozemobacter sibiricus TaxID=2268124 RepID=A0A367ZSL0_9BACT|nr:MAG: hypothetical protein OZSIB_3022 [Candidatus Ozemobacter sibiricus]